MRLIAKEIKANLFSLMYLVFLAAMTVFFVSQYWAGADSAIRKDRQEPTAGDFTEPVPGLERYGTEFGNNPAVIMPNALAALVRDYDSNNYQTYPYSFVRYVRLSEQENAEVAAAIEAITGISIEEVLQIYAAALQEQTVWMEDGGYFVDAGFTMTEDYPVAVEYDVFVAQMQQVDDILGGGSSYAEDSLTGFSAEPKTYEKALADFNESRYEDQFTRGWARLFCDYVGVAIALFSVFVPVSFLLRDKRARAGELVFSRKCSSVRLVLSRYVACLAAIFLPVLLLATAATVQLVPYLLSKGFAVATFAFYFYSVIWLLPTAMVCCSVGFFFTTLTCTPIAIAVQVVWSFLTFTSRNLVGDYAGSFILRNNTHTQRGVMLENLSLLARNRVGFTVLALILLICSILFYDLQRKGRFDVSTQLRRRFGRRTKPAAAHRTV